MGDEEDLQEFLTALEVLENSSDTPEQETDTLFLTLEQVFDLATDFPTREEIARIRKAARDERIIMSDFSHAAQRSGQRTFTIEDLDFIVLYGTTVEKDIWKVRGDRPTGIGFFGTLKSGRKLKVKVSWKGGYFYVTAHASK